MPHEFHFRLFKLKAAGQDRRCSRGLTQINSEVFKRSLAHVLPKPAPAFGAQHFWPEGQDRLGVHRWHPPLPVKGPTQGCERSSARQAQIGPIHLSLQQAQIKCKGIIIELHLPTGCSHPQRLRPPGCFVKNCAVNIKVQDHPARAALRRPALLQQCIALCR